MGENEWVMLTPKTEADPIRGEMSYKHSRSQWPREHMFRCTTPIDEYEWWDVSTTELAAIPAVKALVEAARRLSAEAHPKPGDTMEPPGPDFVIDPATLAELDAALAALVPAND